VAEAKPSNIRVIISLKMVLLKTIVVTFRNRCLSMSQNIGLSSLKSYFVDVQKLGSMFKSLFCRCSKAMFVDVQKLCLSIVKSYVRQVVKNYVCLLFDDCFTYVYVYVEYCLLVCCRCLRMLRTCLRMF
jgi:hypothetical protein